MVKWNAAAIARHMKRHGLENANQLHHFTGLTVPTSYNVLSDKPLERVEVATWETLARAFRCRMVTLLEFLDEPVDELRDEQRDQQPATAADPPASVTG